MYKRRAGTGAVVPEQGDCSDAGPGEERPISIAVGEQDIADLVFMSRRDVPVVGGSLDEDFVMPTGGNGPQAVTGTRARMMR
jgi:hypothetical protein